MLETEIGSCAITNWTKNYRTQLQASFVHPPAELIQMISIMEPSLIETISVTTCSKRAHQSKNHPGLQGQSNLGRIVGVSTHTTRGTEQIIKFRGGSVPESFHRSTFRCRCRFGCACSAEGEEKPSFCLRSLKNT